ADRAELKAEIAAAVQAAKDAQAKVNEREQARAKVTAGEKTVTAARTAVDASRAAADSARSEAATLTGLVAELRARVPEGFDLAASRAEQTGLRSRAEALAAVLTEARTAEDLRTSAAAVQAQFADAAKQSEVDIAPLTVQRNDADVRRKSSHATAQRFESCIEKVTDVHAKFSEQSRVLKAAQEELGRWDAISPYFEGGAGRRIPLTRFYLAQRLAQVAAAASVRLLRMTNGRYQLVHDESASAKHGAKGGLALLVRDNENASVRGPETLSGGETFMASLSLALGLSDVVTAEAGGVRLDSLFIDEGFGTLDADTLEEVLDVLEGLREHNRLVGVVSHVETLKDRIPQQLLVQAGENGSTIRYRAG
ncbi:MAG: hypothetical protein KGO50_19345, partial [Myxococcales bacterium]|nr:hypothetical protein [Myxococcales bacterium]